MKTSKQLSLGPMGLERVATPVASTSNIADVDLCALLDCAFRSQGHTAYGAAEKLGMSPQSYSKAVNRQYIDNPVMKRLGSAENRKVLRVWHAMTGEAIGAAEVDSEQTRVLRAFYQVLRDAA